MLNFLQTIMGVTPLYQKSLALSYLMIVRVTALHVLLHVGVLLVLRGMDAGVGYPDPALA